METAAEKTVMRNTVQTAETVTTEARESVTAAQAAAEQANTEVTKILNALRLMGKTGDSFETIEGADAVKHMLRKFEVAYNAFTDLVDGLNELKASIKEQAQQLATRLDSRDEMIEGILDALEERGIEVKLPEKPKQKEGEQDG
jgi:hypothetical protein